MALQTALEPRSRVLGEDLVSPRRRALAPWADPLARLKDVLDDMATELAAAAAGTDATGRPCRRAVALLRKSELPAIAVPVAYGGLGFPPEALNELVEGLAYHDASLAIIFFQHFAVSTRIAEWGTPAQKDRLLPPLATGESLAASAWSEPGADAAKRRLATTAQPTSGREWTINGAKHFVTGAALADVYLVLVTTSPKPSSDSGYGSDGQTFFLVDSSNPGVSCDAGPDLIGMRGSATGQIALTECKVGHEAVLGAVGDARYVIAGVREHGHSLGAVAVGIAQRAYDLAFAHLAERHLLDQPNVRHRLVDILTRLNAARALVAAAGRRCTQDPGLTTLYSKLFAAESGEEIVAECRRLIGSASFVAAHPINRLVRDVGAIALMGPTSDVCRDVASAGRVDERNLSSGRPQSPYASNRHKG